MVERDGRMYAMRFGIPSTPTQLKQPQLGGPLLRDADRAGAPAVPRHGPRQEGGRGPRPAQARGGGGCDGD